MQKTEANKISIPLRGNNALAAIVAGSGTGAVIKLKEVTFTVDESTQELITGTIDEVGDAEIVKDDEGERTEDEIKETSKAPVMTVMASSFARDSGDRSRDSLTA